MWPNFEEKTYENYFNNELASRSDLYFPLGQVQEGNFGFDSSAFSGNHILWRRMGYPFGLIPPFKGISMSEIADEIEHFLGIEIDNIPLMKTNLLFQYKRPEFITKRSAAEWKYWNREYYRYKIDSEQQKLLMHIHDTFGTKVFISYASPAIQDINELVQVFTLRKIIDRSNFKKAAELNGHRRNTFIKEGTYSIACSEPNRIENFDLIAEIKRLSEESNSNMSKNNREFIKNFCKTITFLVNRNSYYTKSFQELNKTISEFEKFELLHSLLIMKNFRQLTGTQWIIKV